MRFESNLDDRQRRLLAGVRACAEGHGCTALKFNADLEHGFEATLECPGGDWARWGPDFYELVEHLERALRLFFPTPKERYRREDVERVLARLGVESGGSKYQFLISPKGSLALPETGTPRTPLEALADGNVEAVMRTAHAHSER